MAASVKDLRSLMEIDGSVGDLVRRVRASGWGQDEIACLQLRHIVHALSLYQAGTISGDDLALWADTLEGRDDVAYEPQHEGVIAECLFVLATPEVNGGLASFDVSTWIERLGGP
jgi:hypothetical protein